MFLSGSVTNLRFGFGDVRAPLAARKRRPESTALPPNLLQYWRRIRRNPIDHERQRVLNGAVNGFQIGWSAQCLRNQDGIIAHLKLRPERVNLRGT